MKITLLKQQTLPERVNALMVSEFVRSRRKDLGLTQLQLANKAGVSVSVVKRFEANKPYSPSGRSALWISKALGVPADKFRTLEWPK